MKYINSVSIASFALFVMVAGASYFHGSNGKLISPVSSGETIVPSSEKATRVWEQSGTHGRILLLFDRNPHLFGYAYHSGKPELSEATFVEYLIYKNIVRSIVLVVPDGDWENFVSHPLHKSLRHARTTGKSTFLFNLIGIPLVAVAFSTVPPIDEPPLVYINEALFDFDSVRKMLFKNGIRSDSVILMRRSPVP